MNTPDTEMMKLAERVEAATGPDRVLDAEIYVALDPALGNVDALTTSGVVGSWVPHFTASMDDAMTMVPEGWSVTLHTHTGDLSRASAYRGDHACDFSYAATPALAICVAALKPRVYQEMGYDPCFWT